MVIGLITILFWSLSPSFSCPNFYFVKEAKADSIRIYRRGKVENILRKSKRVTLGRLN